MRQPRVDNNAIAELYDSAPYRTRPVDPELLAFLGERPSAAGLTLLDIGCGTGKQLIADRAAVAPAQMVGVDRFVGMLKQAQTKAPQIAWVQDVGGNLMVLAEEVRRAVAWVYENAATIGANPDRLYVGGQSSGGHLAAVALTTDWRRDFGLPVDLIKGGMCISGVYDLTPVRLSARNRYVAFDDATVAALSPIRISTDCARRRSSPTAPARHPSSSARTANSPPRSHAGKGVDLLVGENRNHFELPETLNNPYGLLGRAALDLLGLRVGGVP